MEMIKMSYQTRRKARLILTYFHSQTNILQKRCKSTIPLISIKDGTFYRSFPSSTPSANNPPLFPQLNFLLHPKQSLAVLSSSSRLRSTFLRILSNNFLSIPSSCRTFPALSSRNVDLSKAIRYLDFSSSSSNTSLSSLSSGGEGTYLSSRYESHHPPETFPLSAHLLGRTTLNPTEEDGKLPTAAQMEILGKVARDLKLTECLDRGLEMLSNGQMRRARIGKVLMDSSHVTTNKNEDGKIEIMVLEMPFLGLDPLSKNRLMDVLGSLVANNDIDDGTSIILGLERVEDVPFWITNVISLKDEDGGRIEHLQKTEAGQWTLPSPIQNTSVRDSTRLSREDLPLHHPLSSKKSSNPIVELNNISISYSSSTNKSHNNVLHNLSLTIHPSSRLLLLGSNGSGKSTLLSLLTSDHPQSYAQDVRLFGHHRLPSNNPDNKSLSLFDLQRRIGISSPEFHSCFPRSLSVLRSMQSVFSDAPLSPPTNLTEKKKLRIKKWLNVWKKEILSSNNTSVSTPPTSPHERVKDKVFINSASDDEWMTTTFFHDLTFSAQRVLLFLRTMINDQPLIILDEAFSGMSEAVKTEAFQWMVGKGRKASSLNETNADDRWDGINDDVGLIVVAHEKGDVPGCIEEWICLSDSEQDSSFDIKEGIEEGMRKKVRRGKLPGPLELWPGEWEKMWGVI